MERQLDSPIYNIIDEIEDYISNCKGKFMSSTDIIVNRDIIEEYLRDLKRKAPEEIAQCRRIISKQEEILSDAKTRAKNLIDQTMQQTDQLISQNEIMRRAYEQADEVIRMANEQAQALVDSAVVESNEIRNAASQYMEDVWYILRILLIHLQKLQLITTMH